jgi:hypothetical protein
LSTDRLCGHIKTTKGRTQFLEFCRYLRTLHPPHVRIAIVLDNFSPHLSTKKDQRVGEWAAATSAGATPTPATVNSPNSSTAQTLLDAPLERERVGRFDGGPAGALRRERRDELTEW